MTPTPTTPSPRPPVSLPRTYPPVEHDPPALPLDPRVDHLARTYSDEALAAMFLHATDELEQRTCELRRHEVKWALLIRGGMLAFIVGVGLLGVYAAWHVERYLTRGERGYTVAVGVVLLVAWLVGRGRESAR